jgi:RND family efflux transporter MFP subunit
MESSMSSHNRFSRVILLLLGSSLLALAWAGCGGTPSPVSAAEEKPRAEAAAPSDAVAVPAVKAVTADIEAAIEIAGSLAPQSRVGVTAQLPGTLERVNVQLGDRVAAGAVIGILDRREIDAQVEAAEAAVGVARAALEAAEAGALNATQELERARNLFDKGALPKQRLDAAETGQRAARAQHDLAKASLAQAEASLRRAGEVQRDTILASPIAGVIVERNQDAGSLVGRGEAPIVVVADTRVLKLEAGVSEFEAGRLRIGLPAQVAVAARPGQTFQGRVAALAPQVDARNRHFRVEVRVNNPGDALLAGMYATARVVVARAAAALVVPKDAVSTREGRRTVLRIDGATVRPNEVMEGIADDQRVQILSGLRPGDLVVADGRRELAAGTRVKPIEAPVSRASGT